MVYIKAKGGIKIASQSSAWTGTKTQTWDWMLGMMTENQKEMKTSLDRWHKPDTSYPACLLYYLSSVDYKHLEHQGFICFCLVKYPWVKISVWPIVLGAQ